MVDDLEQAPLRAWKKGDKVWVFNLEIRDEKCNDHLCYVAVQDHSHGCYRPRVGLSEGWVPATITKDFNPQNFQQGNRNTWVQYINDWELWFNARGSMADK